MNADPERPPLGSWPRIYALTIVLAVALMAALWWFTDTWNLPGGGR